MLFSILIPTIESRKVQFHRLHHKLSQQIQENALESTVEIVWFLDNKEHSVGYKRNQLIAWAKGTFVAFVDDDDEVSDDYVQLICQAIQTHPAIDCIGMKGIITFAGKNPRLFVHSVRYKDYFTRDGTYCRPPYHLNPIRRDIACRYRFEDVSYSEDIDWAMRICQEQVLREEYFIDKVIYYYYSRRSWRYQRLLDWSEPLRHALGLRLANRLHIKRWFTSLSS